MLDQSGKIKDMSKSQKQLSKFIGFGLVTIIIISLIAKLTIVQIPANHIGVSFNRISGEINEQPLKQGWNFKVPLVEEVSKISTELRSADVDGIQVTTKDAQGITIDVEIQYQVQPEDAIETYKQYVSTDEDEWIQTFVYQRIQRGIQEAASEYTVSEVLGDKRGVFQVDVDQTVAEALKSNHLTLKTASTDKIQVSSAITESIESKIKAKQEVETAEQEKQRQKVENEKKIEKEKADAEIKKINAEAEARIEHGWIKYKNMEPTITEKGE